MGQKLQNTQPVLSSKRDENRRYSSSRGLFGVFHLWQSCSNQRLKLVSGSEHRKRIQRDKMDNKNLGIDNGKRTVKALMDEESSEEKSKFVPVGFSKKKQKNDKPKSNLFEDKKEAEDFINEALKKYLYKDRRNHCSQRFLDALTILKSNDELFLKLIEDPNSLLAKHIRNLQEQHAEKERSNLLIKPNSSEEALGTMNLIHKQKMYSLSWGKIKTRYEYPSKLRKNHRALRKVEISENMSCHCSMKKKDIVEPSYFSFKIKSKSTKGDEGKESKGFIKSEIASKGRDFDIVEEEGKRHLSERLMISNQKKCVSDKESPSILGKILRLPQSQIFDLELEKLRNRLLDTKGHAGISTITDDISLADQMEHDLSKSEDFNILGLSSSPSSTNGTMLGQNIGSVSISEKAEDSKCSGQRLLSLQDDSSLITESVNIPSPVSVLESLFLDDNSSPSTIAQPGNSTIQPINIDFEEHSPMNSPPNHKIKSENLINELDLMSTYIEALLQTSSLSRDELFLSWKPYSAYQFFDPNLINEVQLPLIDYCDHIILFDSVNESISEMYQCCFKSSPFASSMLPKEVPIETCVVDEIKRKVNHYFHPRVLPQTIEQLAGEDHVRSQTWMDIREDIEEITVQVVEFVVEVLIQETVFESLC